MSVSGEDMDEADVWSADVVAMPAATGCSPPRLPRLRTLDEILPSLRAAWESGERPVEWTPDETPWGSLTFRPGAITVIGSPSATGKTSLVVNLLGRMLARYPALRVLVASNEMSTEVLMDRLLAMHSGISYSAIRNRDKEFRESSEYAHALAEFTVWGPRLSIIERPFTLEAAHDRATAFGAQIVFLDFLQATRVSGNTRDAQQRVAEMMQSLRDLADTGICVITTAAMSRAGIKHASERVGRTDSNDLDMGVFLHASEIEHFANNAYLLLAAPGVKIARSSDDQNEPIPMWLQCVKARDSAKVHVPLVFEGSIQRFTLADEARNTRSRQASRPGEQAPIAQARPKTRPPKAATRQTKASGGTFWLS